MAAPCSHGTLARCWRSWQEALMLRRQKAARLQAAVGHWRAANMSAAFCGWRQAVDRARQLRSKAVVVVGRMQHMQLAAAMAAWREACGRRAEKRQVLQACVARLQQGACVARLQQGAAACCLASWRARVAQRVQLRSLAERCILRLHQLVLARAWEQVRGAWGDNSPDVSCGVPAPLAWRGCCMLPNQPSCLLSLLNLFAVAGMCGFQGRQPRRGRGLPTPPPCSHPAQVLRRLAGCSGGGGAHACRCGSPAPWHSRPRASGLAGGLQWVASVENVAA